jgi:hypothetical protein
MDCRRNASLVGLLGFMLLSGCHNSQPGAGDSPVKGDKAKELMIGKWKYQGQDEFMEIEYTAKEWNAKYNVGGNTGESHGNYDVADDVIVGFPPVGGGMSQDAKIVSISKDKMVLSLASGPGNPNAPVLEFIRQE